MEIINTKMFESVFALTVQTLIFWLKSPFLKHKTTSKKTFYLRRGCLCLQLCLLSMPVQIYSQNFCCMLTVYDEMFGNGVNNYTQFREKKILTRRLNYFKGLCFPIKLNQRWLKKKKKKSEIWSTEKIVGELIWSMLFTFIEKCMRKQTSCRLFLQLSFLRK